MAEIIAEMSKGGILGRSAALRPAALPEDHKDIVGNAPQGVPTAASDLCSHIEGSLQHPIGAAKVATSPEEAGGRADPVKRRSKRRRIIWLVAGFSSVGTASLLAAGMHPQVKQLVTDPISRLSSALTQTGGGQQWSDVPVTQVTLQPGSVDRVQRDLEAARGEADNLRQQLASARLQVEALQARGSAETVPGSPDGQVLELERVLGEQRGQTERLGVELEGVREQLRLAREPNNTASLFTLPETEKPVAGQVSPSTDPTNTRSERPIFAPNDLSPNSGEDPLLGRAKTLLRQGKLRAARILLARAAQNGNAAAANLLAQTFDSRALAAWHIVGAGGEPARARELKLRTLDSGGLTKGLGAQ